MPTTAKPRLLVKTRSGRTLSERGFQWKASATAQSKAETPFQVAPLFSQPQQDGGFAVAGAAQWYVVEAAETLDREENPWDVTYRALQDSLGFAAADRPQLVEPDLLQSWSYENRAPLLSADEAFAAAEQACQFNDQHVRGGKTPAGPAFGWFLGDDFSQLRSAREMVGAGQRRVRIAHIDTGYDPDHVTRPAHLNTALQRSFVDGETPDNAQDRSRRGTLKNPGHGPGTLGILAGNVLKNVPFSGPLANLPLGGAPEAEIIPLRVANSVVHFRTSAVARAFEYLTVQGADVVSMSMGGLASAAWTEAVNRAYEAGVVMVCAAGNNFGGVPTRFIVYPARYKRVIAACGVMANHQPYCGLPIKIMQGNWGPRGKMKTALAAYTPNMPWAELGCPKIVDMDGQGTSSATPQIAAAAALWLMHHNPAYPQGWMKVEAVRKALFDTARDAGESKHLGNGILQAKDALGIAPAAEAELRQTARDTARFPLARLLTGLGATRNPRTALFELEAAQLLQTAKSLEEILVRHGIDPDSSLRRIPPKVHQELVEAMAEEPACSQTLRDQLGRRSSALHPQTAVQVARAKAPAVPDPRCRTLRIYAFDPAMGLELSTAVLNQTTVEVPWEPLAPGPVGNYLEVVDIDPASDCAYAPVDLNDPRILAQHGLAPSEGNPQFHQQMVYAVAMKTISHFEQALGRVALWAPRAVKKRRADGSFKYDDVFVPRLRIYPHALRDANAYYSPQRKALLFGYFPASRTAPGRNLPGGMVFTGLSHDVVAHETTHALLDGLHRRFAEPSNPDVYAFHEAFADLVALFQHFSIPAALHHQIAKTRGDLTQQNLLGMLAQQFGEALGHEGALRDAIGLQPDPSAYLTEMESHRRGAILVAAVFDAFLAIYTHRSRDLMRLATSGTGVLPAGAIHPDLVKRLADEAAKTAQHVLRICIRALDYCPPVDITFGEYLRALITADADLVPFDPRHYRVAFIEAFRQRGIYPENVRTLSVDSLRWRPPANSDPLQKIDSLLKELDLSWDLGTDRHQAYQQSKENCRKLHRWCRANLPSPAPWREMGLAWGDKPPDWTKINKKGEVATEIHAVRPARRLAPDGSFITEVVVEITQRRRVPRDPKNLALGTFQFRGGCTLLVDPKARRVRYCIKKSLFDQERLARQRRYEMEPGAASLHATYFSDPKRRSLEPFAMLHRGH